MLFIFILKKNYIDLYHSTPLAPRIGFYGVNCIVYLKVKLDVLFIFSKTSWSLIFFGTKYARSITGVTLICGSIESIQYGTDKWKRHEKLILRRKNFIPKFKSLPVTTCKFLIWNWLVIPYLKNKFHSVFKNGKFIARIDSY